MVNPEHSRELRIVMEDLDILKERIKLLHNMVVSLTDAVITCEKTARLVLIANWDKANDGGPPPELPSFSPSSKVGKN